MELKLGKMSTQELADWMGIKIKTFRDNATKKLEELSKFCKFTRVYGGVIIEEIYISKFVKNLNDDVKIYLEKVKTAVNHLATVSGIVKELMQTDEYADYSYGTLIYRMTKAGKDGFGVTADVSSRGIYGSRRYVWAIKCFDRENHYRYLTQEEQELFDSLTTAYYSSNENAHKIQAEKLLDKAYQEADEMDKEEYFSLKEELGLDTFKDVIENFYMHTGHLIVKATEHEIYECAFSQEQIP